MFSHFAVAVEIITDTSQAPDLEPFAAKVRQELTDWFQYISELLHSPTYIEPTTIPIYFDPNYDGVAYASGGRIVGSVNYYRTHQDDVGSMIHEMTHVIQSYRNGVGWLTEGIADWVRYFKYEPERKPNKPGPSNNYTQGYGVSAYFLEWIQINVGDMVYWCNKDCREGTYADTIWPRLTGRDLNQLWREMREGDPV